jgi:hypothetical protein
VPAPAALLAELSVGDPKETWRRLRLLGGDSAEALPSSLPVLLTTSLGLPMAAASSLDESLPLVGALLARGPGAEPDVVLGMHVVSGAELVASLTLGDSAKLRRQELGPKLVRLLPAPGAPELSGALGISGNYLLLATRLEALTEAGRFVAEGVSRRARSEPGLSLRTTEKLLAGTLTQAIRSAWQARRAALSARDQAERQAKGRAPDFADPQALLAGADNLVESWLGVLESARELTLQVTPEADRLRVELGLTPAASGAAALMASELVVGKATPLFQLPASTRAALLLRGDDKPAPGAESSLSQAVSQLFGERLSAEQNARVGRALGALQKSRHGVTAVGLLTAPAPALVLSCELSDPAAFRAAVADALTLVELAPVSLWLGSTLGKPALSVSAPAGAVQQARLRFQRARAAPGLTLPSELSVSWEARDGVGYVVISPDPKLGLAPFAPDAPRLGASNWLGRSDDQLGDRAALALFVDARLLAPGGGGPDGAPLLLSFGKRSSQILLSLEAAPSALSALSQLFALDR